MSALHVNASGPPTPHDAAAAAPSIPTTSQSSSSSSTFAQEGAAWERLRLEGNQLFKEQRFSEASEKYTEAFFAPRPEPPREAKAALLCNRAACHLRLGRPQDCVDDCSAAIELDPSFIKAYYRRAQGLLATAEPARAVRDLTYLLRLDPGNKDAAALLRDASKSAQAKAADDSEVARSLQVLANHFNTTADAKADSKELDVGKRVEAALKHLVSLCHDDLGHATELLRRRGVVTLRRFMDAPRTGGRDQDHLLALSLRVLLACAQHKSFVASAFDIRNNVDVPTASVQSSERPSGHIASVDGTAVIDLTAIVALVAEGGDEVSRTATSLVLKVIQQLPTGTVTEVPAERGKAEADGEEEDVEDAASQPRVEEVDEEGRPLNNATSKKKKQASRNNMPTFRVDLFLKQSAVDEILRGWLKVVKRKDCEPETFHLALDAIIAFVSEMDDYVTSNKMVDARNESTEDRRQRLDRSRLTRARSRSHALCALESTHCMDVLVPLLDAEEESRRTHVTAALSKIFAAIDDDNVCKRILKPFVCNYGQEPSDDADANKTVDTNNLPSVRVCRYRAWIEAILLVAKPEIGLWAMQQAGGVKELMLLSSTPDVANQEAAVEVFCLAASSENASALLAPVVSSGLLPRLLDSPGADVRSAAASTLTKLGLKAHALADSSAEATSALNVALSVIKNAVSSGANSKSVAKNSKAGGITTVSFSHLDATAAGAEEKSRDGLSLALEKKSLASVERAVEVVAALVGKSAMKEEVTFGSSRVAPILPHLTALVVDERSTAAYGVAHVLAALTVTNRELRDRALAERDITAEQFQQLQELQRVKTKNDKGEIIEEKKQDEDADTADLCRRRIKKVAASHGFEALFRLLSHTSTQTLLSAATALRQMCVEPSVRGLFVQLGGIKACHDIAVDENCDRAVRREAAHAVAKALVTTNPTLLSEHLRLSAFKPLLYLCKDVEATNLMQFEALLSLTNLTSCGEAEQERFVAEKGVNAVHYLMFSDHMAVRRAATETLCNLSGHEALLKFMRAPDKVRLWLAFCEDWGNAENPEALATAMAASGTLAVAVADSEVAGAVLSEGCGKCISALVLSGEEGLAHRALVCASNLLESEQQQAAARVQLTEGGDVKQAVRKAIALYKGNPTIAELCDAVGKLLV